MSSRNNQPEEPPKPKKLTKRQLQKLKEEQKRLKAQRANEEKARAAQRSQQRWDDCVECLREIAPVFREDPWLLILEPPMIHAYLDSLSEVTAKIKEHQGDENFAQVTDVLREVFETFVDAGEFVQYQPAFYIEDPQTIKRLVKVLGQVSDSRTDKALFPNVLQMFGPTFARPELYDLLANSNIVHWMLTFARSDQNWIPGPKTLVMLLKYLAELSQDETMMKVISETEGFDRLKALTLGTTPGFSEEQQDMAKKLLHRFLDLSDFANDAESA